MFPCAAFGGVFFFAMDHICFLGLYRRARRDYRCGDRLRGWRLRRWCFLLRRLLGPRLFGRAWGFFRLRRGSWARRRLRGGCRRLLRYDLMDRPHRFDRRLVLRLFVKDRRCDRGDHGAKRVLADYVLDCRISRQQDGNRRLALGLNVVRHQKLPVDLIEQRDFPNALIIVSAKIAEFGISQKCPVLGDRFCAYFGKCLTKLHSLFLILFLPDSPVFLLVPAFLPCGRSWQAKRRPRSRSCRQAKP